MQPLSGNQRPDLRNPPNISDGDVSCTEMHLFRSSSNVPRPPSSLKLLQEPTGLAHFRKGAKSIAPATQKDLETARFWASRISSRHSGSGSVHLFCISILNVHKCSEPLSGWHFWLPNVLGATTAFLFQPLNCQKRSEYVVLFAFWLHNELHNTVACTFSASEPPKVVWTCFVFGILTSKCASRHSGVQFFDICQKCPEPGVLSAFTYWLPHVLRAKRRALVQHLHCHKCSEHVVLWAFWLPNVLRTAACTCVHFCNISTAKNAPNRLCFQHFDFQMCFVSHERALFDQLNFQKCSDNIRKCCAFYVLTSKRASRHSIVHLFHISTSKSAPRPHFFLPFCLPNVLRATAACNFWSLISPDGSVPLLQAYFSTLRATKYWKNTVFRDFLKPYHVGWSFSPLTLSHLRSSFFFLSRLWLFPPLPFPSVHIDHIVGSLTSKLPSIIQHAYPFWVGNLLQLRQSLPRQWAQGWRPWGDGWTCSGHDWQRPKPSPFELVPDLQYFVVGSVT